MLSTDRAVEGPIRCPHCRKDTFVAAEIAALPEPILPGTARPDADLPDSFDPADDPPPDEPGERESLLTRSTPWVVSVSANAALALVLLLITMISTTTDGQSLPIPGLFRPGPQPMIQPKQIVSGKNPTRPVHRSQRPRFSPKEKPDRPSLGSSDNVPDVIGMGEGIGSNFGPGSGPIDGGTDVVFPPPSGNIRNIVFVIDRSGSMSGWFEIVKQEMLVSIGRMGSRQRFHVVFFADKDPLEKSPARLVQATGANKDAAADFLDSIVAEGSTSPSQALKRAFRVLPHTGEASQIYLLTDAVFPDDQDVFDVIAKHKPGNNVLISTVLFGQQSDHAERVLRRIAADSGGRFKYVSWDELH